MRNLLKVLGSAAIALVVSCPVRAYDFSVDGLLFNIVDEFDVDVDLIIDFEDDGNPILAKCVEVTYDPEKHDSQLGSYSGALTIPESVSYNGEEYFVIAIGHEAFRYCDALTSVSEGYRVRYIRDYAFADCSITDCSIIADNNRMFDIKEIGEYAFARSGIKNIRLSASTHIGQYAFSASAVEDVWLFDNHYNGGVKYFDVPDYCFKDCVSLSRVYGGDWGSVGISAFENCTNLYNILGSEYISEKAYKGCGLTYITISSHTKYIETQAFAGCKELRRIEIERGSNVLEFDEQMQIFKGCNDIRQIEIGRQMVTDAETRESCNPFEGCTAERLIFRNWGLSLPMTSTSFPNLNSIECRTAIPPQIGTLSARQYSDVTVTVPATVLQSYKNSPYWEDFDHINASNEISVSGPVEYNGLYYEYGTVVRNPFGFYKGTFEIPVAIEYDGESCDVSIIDKEAFFNCPEVKKVTFAAGSKVYLIDDYAFARSGIETIELPEIVQTVQDEMFKSYFYFGKNVFWNCQNLTEVQLPEATNIIANGMFQDCPRLSKINFPTDIMRIEDWAFSDCVALTAIDLGDCTGLSSIGRGAFERCNISNLKLPECEDYSTKIGSSAFADNKITDIVIPKTYYIAEYAFGNNPISNITIGDQVTVFEKGEIAAGAAIKTLTIEGRLYIDGPGSDVPTYPCNWLGANAVNKIVFLQDRFNHDWNWPTWNVKEIEMHLATYAPAIGDYFTEAQYRDVIVTVPENAYELYRDAPVWCKFKNMRGVDFSGIESIGNADMVIRGDYGRVVINNAKSGSGITVYTIDGKCVANTKMADGDCSEIPLQRGIYIVNIAGGCTHKVSVK